MSEGNAIHRHGIMTVRGRVPRSAFSAILAVLEAGAAMALEPGKTEAVASTAVYVVDGDTIRVGGFSYRLVGFGAPEIGRTARCEREVAKGYDAKAALVGMVRSGKPLTLERVTCSCAPSSPEGSQFCNYGRRCGTLRVAGESVGTILMRDRLAKSYPYAWNHVPPKPEWCGRP